MDINVFLVCFNESALLPHTIKHYKTYLPSCKITIYDNYSTDNSVQIAENLGCSIKFWDTNGITDEYELCNLKNNCWKSVEKGWIIMADMDEFLCVTEDDLYIEQKQGTTILSVKGYDMIGESETIDLSDIDLESIKKYIDNFHENKNLCFLRDIKEINYGIGSHSCSPKGDKIQYSSTIYINKHMPFLGLKFVTNRYIERYKRSKNMREKGLDSHYTEDLVKIENIYKNKINTCKLFTF